MGGEEREYYLYVPPSAAGHRAPTLFVLHGGAAEGGLEMHAKCDFTPLGEKVGYVTVYPSGVRGWNTGDPRSRSTADDVAFFAAMFDSLVAEGVADPDRLYVIGGSNGGVMTYSLMCQLSSRIAAAGVVVATMEDYQWRDCPTTRPVPVMVMLGTEDPMHPYEGKPGMYSAEQNMTFWREKNGCADRRPPEQALADCDAGDGTRVYRTDWDACRCGASVVLYRMEGAGHGWPQNPPNDQGVKTRDIHAPDEFWPFLERHRLRSCGTEPAPTLPPVTATGTGTPTPASPTPSLPTPSPPTPSPPTRPTRSTPAATPTQPVPPTAPARWSPTPSPARAEVYVPLVLDAVDVSALPTPEAPAPEPTQTAEAGTIGLQSGSVIGTLDGGAWRFLGIPYAAPPVGDLRWRPPAPAPAWSTALRADAFGPACPQYDADGTVFGDEDCLTLNVWTPRDAPASGSARPVLLFVHGGGHEQGSSSATIGDRAMYDGRIFAEERGVVVVTINYRLGPFGFLAHPALSAEGGASASGNYGALDQLAALRWVRDNIRAFGGDPARVTVFGQSAGSVSTCRLVVSPLARGLVHGAALMSGACVATPLKTAEARGVVVATSLGCSGASDVPGCLRARSTAQIMSTLDPMDNGTDSLGRMSYDGVIDGYLLPDAPRTLIAARRHNPVPILIGTTSAENGNNAGPINAATQYEAAVRAYVQRSGLPASVADRALVVYPASAYPTPRDAYVALTSDVKFVCQARTDARLFAAAQSAPVFRYLFDHVPDNAGAQARSRGAFHGLELPYLFGLLESGLGGLRYRPGTGDLAVAASMQACWSRFAATGDPNGTGTVAWPEYVPADDPYLRIAPAATAGMGLRTAECDFWDGLTGD